MKRIVCILLVAASCAVWADDLSAGLARNKVSCENAEANLTFRWQEGPNESQLRTHPYRVFWAVNGGDSRVTYLSDAGNPHTTFLTTGDQSASYDVNPGEPATVNVTYTKAKTNPVNALMYGLQVGGRWYADLVADGTLKPVEVATSADFTEVEGTLETGWRCHLWLKPSAGYLAVRAVTEDPGSSAKQETTVDQWKRIGSAFFPTHGEMVTHDEVGGQPRLIKVEMGVSDLRIGNVPESVFELPKLVPGSTVKNDREMKMWEIGPNGEKIFRGNVHPVENSSPVATMTGWAFLLAVASTSFCAVLAAKSRLGKNAIG